MPTFQGAAAAEAKITDTQIGELLAAAGDKRMGGRSMASAETSWIDVHNIPAHWAQLVRFRLCEQQGARRLRAAQDRWPVKPGHSALEREPGDE